MIDTYIIYKGYADFLKKSLIEKYNKDEPKIVNQVPTFIGKVLKSMKLDFKYIDGDLLFYQVYGNMRIEIIVKNPQNFTDDNVFCRIMDYNSLWENGKYIIYSDCDEYKDTFKTDYNQKLKLKDILVV